MPYSIKNMKKITSIKIDEELIEEAKRRGLKISEIAEEALKRRIKSGRNLREEREKELWEEASKIVSGNVIEKAREIYQKSLLDPWALEKLKNRSLEGLIASAIYVASALCKERVSQRILANALGTTEQTIRKIYKIMVAVNERGLA
jgi:transcription initiation factor TFIIIB Brf1 subunit/transcription initiation factor TFIIB